MPLNRVQPLASAASGVFAFVWGVLVMLGWVTGTSILLRPGDNAVATVASTGLCLALSGLALAAPTWSGGFERRLSMLAGTSLVGISAVMLGQITLGVNQGISLPAVHAWMHDTNPYPGRMAPGPALGFLLIGLGLVTETMWRDRPGMLRLRGAIGTIVAISGLIGLLAHFVHPELLFGYGRNLPRMAPYTSVGLMALGIGFTNRWRPESTESDAPEVHRRRIFYTVAVALTMVALISGTAGFALQMNSVTQKAHEHLSRTLGDRRVALEDALGKVAQMVELTSTNPAVIEKLVAASSAHPAGTSARQGLATMAKGLLAHGFSHVAFETTAGPVASAGTSIGSPALEVPLLGRTLGSLAWQQGYFVRHRQAIQGPSGLVGYVVTEQPLKMLALLSDEIANWGDSFDMALCTSDGARIVCFPQRQSREWFSAPKMMNGQPLPMALALNGQTGLTSRLDFRHHPVIAAYAPVGVTGLGMVLKVDAEELYAPIRHQFLVALPTIFLIVLAGLWALRLRLRPVVQALVQARLAAQANEARFVAAMESGLDAFYILRAERNERGDIVDFRFTYVTSRGAALLSLTRAQVEGQLLCEIRPINRTGGYFDKYKAVLESGMALAEESPIQDAGVAASWLSYQVVKMDDDSIAITTRDISERKRDEHALILSQERLKEVTDNVPALIAYIDREHRFRFANLAHKEWLGVDPEGLIGTSLHELYGEATYAKIRPYLDRAFAGETLSYERDFDGKDRKRIVHVTMTPRCQSDGEVLGLYVLISDITPLKEAEMQSARSQERLALALEGSHLALFDWNLTTHQVYNSAQWSSMLGGPAIETTTSVESMKQLVHPEDLPSVLAKVKSALKGATPFYSAEHRVRIGTGDWLWILSRGRVVERDANGRALRLSGTNADISEQKSIEARLQHMAEIDVLTQLPNRAFFNDRLSGAMARCKRKGTRMALMLLDIDFFKKINDGLGHDAGDAILREFGRRLSVTVRQTDTVARLGGDEFAVILEEISAPREAEMVADKILAVMAEEFSHAGKSLRVTSSIGVAYLEQPVEEAASLIKRADQALYSAKAAGRNTYRSAAANQAELANPR
ncbi:MAG: diguanylate cyclase [Burkholderiales bacterium]|nr:diguanylate cyclase [Burkholderiales bacterium]